ncbi:hypothetical protein BH11PLA1_BH11PLA1_08840 [soil metagenome]
MPAKPTLPRLARANTYDQPALYLRILTWTTSAVVTLAITCTLYPPSGFEFFLFAYGFPVAAPIAVIAAVLFQPYLHRKALWFPPLALPLLALTAGLIRPGDALLMLFSAPCTFGLLVFLELIARGIYKRFSHPALRV